MRLVGCLLVMCAAWALVVLVFLRHDQVPSSEPARVSPPSPSPFASPLNGRVSPPPRVAVAPEAACPSREPRILAKPYAPPSAVAFPAPSREPGPGQACPAA
jgi:hypothetical protein